MAFLYLATMNFNCFLMQPRQTGKTIAAVAFYLYIYNFRTKNTVIPLLNKEFKDSKENLARIRAMRDLLPSFLRFDAVFSIIDGKKKKVPNTAIKMEHAVNHNQLRTYAKELAEEVKTAKEDRIKEINEQLDKIVLIRFGVDYDLLSFLNIRADTGDQPRVAAKNGFFHNDSSLHFLYSLYDTLYHNLSAMATVVCFV